MKIAVGQIHQISWYPVKSMAGIFTDAAFLGWHGIPGDRRYAFCRQNDTSDFPWLSASKMPELLLYQPIDPDHRQEPTVIRTPDGQRLMTGDPALDALVSEKSGMPVTLMKLRNGIFDEACVSVINSATIAKIAQEAGISADPRRFRANIVIDTEVPDPFIEDTWVGGQLIFGDHSTSPAISVTMRDLRCMMINLDPDTARQDASVMRAAVQCNDNHAGVYGTVVREGDIRVGQNVYFVI